MIHKLVQGKILCGKLKDRYEEMVQSVQVVGRVLWVDGLAE